MQKSGKDWKNGIGTDMHYTQFQGAITKPELLQDTTCCGRSNICSSLPRSYVLHLSQSKDEPQKNFFIKQNYAVQMLLSDSTVHSATHNLLLLHLLPVNTPTGVNRNLASI